MKRFKLTANIEFEADSLASALYKLHKHFLHQLRERGNDQWFTGHLNLEPIPDSVPPTLGINIKEIANTNDKFGG